MLHGCEITTFLSLSLPLSSFFSLSLPNPSFSLFCCVVTSIHPGFLGPCTTLFALHPPLPALLPLCPPPPSLSPSHVLLLPPLSVVYQDGFYGAADLYVSKFTSNRHTISVPPLTAFSCSFFFSLLGWFCMCVRSCAAQSCLHNGEWWELFRSTTCHIPAQDPLSFVHERYFSSTNVLVITQLSTRCVHLKKKKKLNKWHRVMGSTTPLQRLLCRRMRQRASVNECVRACVYPGWQRLFLFSL